MVRGAALILSDRLGFSLPTATCTARPPLLNTAGGGVFLIPSLHFFKEPAAATTGTESSIAPFVPRDLTAGVSVGPSDSKFLAQAFCHLSGLTTLVPKVQTHKI